MPLLYKAILHSCSICDTPVWWHFILCSGDKAWKIIVNVSAKQKSNLKKMTQIIFFEMNPWMTKCLMWLPAVTALLTFSVFPNHLALMLVSLCHFVHTVTHISVYLKKCNTSHIPILKLTGFEVVLFLPKLMSIYGQHYTWLWSVCNLTVVVLQAFEVVIFVWEICITMDIPLFTKMLIKIMLNNNNNNYSVL